MLNCSSLDYWECFSWFLCPLDISIIMFLTLLSGTISCILSCMLPACPCTSHFSRRSCSSFWKMVLEIKIGIQPTATWLFLLGLSADKAKKDMCFSFSSNWGHLRFTGISKSPSLEWKKFPSDLSYFASCGNLHKDKEQMPVLKNEYGSLSWWTIAFIYQQ